MRNYKQKAGGSPITRPFPSLVIVAGIISITILITGIPLPAKTQSLTSHIADSARAVASAAKQEHLPRNIVARLQILSQAVQHINPNSLPLKSYLGFFSQTRVLFWNSSPGKDSAENMKVLEQAMVQFAHQNGFNLDLPPVGGQTSSYHNRYPNRRPLNYPTEVRFTKEALISSSARCDSLAADLWSKVRNQPIVPGDQRARQDLAGLAEACHGFALALSQGQPLSRHFKAVQANRLRLLFSYGFLHLAPALQAKLNTLFQQLDILVEAYRQLYPPGHAFCPGLISIKSHTIT